MKFIFIRALTSEAGAELLKLFRAPEFFIPTLALPLAFYSLFGIVLQSGRPEIAAYMLATFGVFTVMGPSMFGFGVGVANERDRGWLSVKRASPAPAATYISAKLIAAILFSSIALGLLYAVAGFAGGVGMPRIVWVQMLALHLSAAIPFSLLGLTLGFLMNANGAVAVTNIVYLALSALGGLWMPIFIFPEIMQQIARFLPSYHYAELALFVSGAEGDRDPGVHIMILALTTGIFALTALGAWARQRR